METCRSVHLHLPKLRRIQPLPYMKRRQSTGHNNDRRIALSGRICLLALRCCVGRSAALLSRETGSSYSSLHKACSAPRGPGTAGEQGMDMNRRYEVMDDGYTAVQSIIERTWAADLHVMRTVRDPFFSPNRCYSLRENADHALRLCPDEFHYLRHLEQFGTLRTLLLTESMLTFHLIFRDLATNLKIPSIDHLVLCAGGPRTAWPSSIDTCPSRQPRGMRGLTDSARKASTGCDSGNQLTDHPFLSAGCFNTLLTECGHYSQCSCTALPV
jgi:hypothetical protein